MLLWRTVKNYPLFIIKYSTCPTLWDCLCLPQQEKYGAESYKANVQQALDYLHANVPRAFVNLVEVLPISVTRELNANLLCDVIHL